MGVLALLDEECLLLPRSTDKVLLRLALGTACLHEREFVFAMRYRVCGVRNVYTLLIFMGVGVTNG